MTTLRPAIGNTVALDRFTPNGPSGYAAVYNDGTHGPTRSTREEAEADYRQQLQNRFEALEYVTQMGPEKFADYDRADQAQADVDGMLETLSGISEYHEPKLHASLFADVVDTLEWLESQIA